MKIYDTLDLLENKIDVLVKELENQLVMSITAYDCYIKPYNNVFKD